MCIRDSLSTTHTSIKVEICLKRFSHTYTLLVMTKQNKTKDTKDATASMRRRRRRGAGIERTFNQLHLLQELPTSHTSGIFSVIPITLK